MNGPQCVMKKKKWMVYVTIWARGLIYEKTLPKRHREIQRAFPVIGKGANLPGETRKGKNCRLDPLPGKSTRLQKKKQKGTFCKEKGEKRMTNEKIELTESQKAKILQMLTSMYINGMSEALLDRTTDEPTIKRLVEIEEENTETIDRLSRELFGGPIL